MLTYQVNFSFVSSNHNLLALLNEYYDKFKERANYTGYKLEQDNWEKSELYFDFLYELDSFKELYLQTFKFRCPLCLSSTDISNSLLTFAHPIGKNKEYPEIINDYKNIMPLCESCHKKYNVNYKIKRCNSINNIYDLSQKIPNIVIPYLESNLIHITNKPNNIASSRYLKSTKVFLPTLIDELEEIKKNSINDEEIIYKQLHKKYLKNQDFYDDFEYAVYLRNKNNSFNSRLIKDDIKKRQFSPISPLFFSYKNLRELRTGEIRLSEKPYLCFLGENGVGKTTLLKSIYFTLTSDQNKKLKSENLSYRKDRGIDLSFNYISNNKNTSKHLYSFNKKIERWESSDVKENTSYKKDLSILYLDDTRNSHGRHELEINWLFEQSNTIFSQVAIIIKDFLDLNDTTLYRSGNSIYCDFQGRRKNLSKLSSGYKAIISLIISIYKKILISDVEYSINGFEFKNITLIDEVELHLHPKWKVSIVEKLIRNFPEVFFLITTHDPLVLKQCNDELCFKIVKDQTGKSDILDVIDFSSYDIDMLLSSSIFEIDYEHNHEDRYPNESLRKYLARNIVNSSVKNYKNMDTETLAMKLEMALRNEKNRS